MDFYFRTAFVVYQRFWNIVFPFLFFSMYFLSLSLIFLLTKWLFNRMLFSLPSVSLLTSCLVVLSVIESEVF